MIGRVFVKRPRLLQGGSEIIKTRFELNETGQLVEHVIVETHDRPQFTATVNQPQQPREESRD